MSSTSKYKATPTYSFKGKTEWTTKNNLPSAFPSPDSYNPEKKSMRKSPQIKFAKSRRAEWKQIKSKELSPGPGTHQLPSSFIFQSSKKQAKPSRNVSRFLSVKSLTPGPNAYKNDSMLLKHTSSSYSMPKKTVSTQDKIRQMNQYKPGPGAHEQPILKYSSQNMKIGQSKRPVYVSSVKSPGPGAYQVNQNFKKSVSSESKPKFSKQIRKIEFSLGQRSPGPCSYEKKNFMDDINKKQFTMRKKISLKNILASIPGPGQYQTPIINKNKSAPVINIGKQSRVSFTDRKTQINKFIPGPGSHDLSNHDKIQFRSISSYKFKGKSQIMKRKSSLSQINVGPGQYQTSKSFIIRQKSSPHFSMDSKTKRISFTDKIQRAPGPGEYEPKTQLIEKSQFTHKMQKSIRPNLIKHLQKLPGPGEYNMPKQKRLGREFKFSKELRKNYNDEKIKHEKVTVNQSYQSRQQFPNPPKYMGVTPKIIFNEKKIAKYG